MMPDQAPAPSDATVAAWLTLAPSADDDISVRVVDAALEEMTLYGLRRVSVDDIARRAGVHRVTVYKRFKNKDEVVKAAVAVWLLRFFGAISEAVVSLPTPEDRIVESFVLALQGMRTDPLVSRLLENEPETIVPAAIASSTLVAVRTFMADRTRREYPDMPEVDVNETAELVARAGLSFLLTPESVIGVDDPDGIRRFARRYLQPLFARAHDNKE